MVIFSLPPGNYVCKIFSGTELIAKRNLEVLNSYWVWSDGQNQWFEIILIDPHHHMGMGAPRDWNKFQRDMAGESVACVVGGVTTIVTSMGGGRPQESTR
jgi:hypothetical protein